MNLTPEQLEAAMAFAAHTGETTLVRIYKDNLPALRRLGGQLQADTGVPWTDAAVLRWLLAVAPPEPPGGGG